MLNRIHTIFVLASCMMGGLVMACNAPDDEPSTESEAVDSAEQALSAETSVEVKPPTKELSREWVRWASALPKSTGPIADLTGEKCAMGQDGPVWFLAGTYIGDGTGVTRECTIPAGKELFFPLINFWFLYYPEFYPTKESIDEVTPEFLNAFEVLRQHTCTLTLRVDGEDVFAEGFDAMFEDLYVLVPNQFEIYLNPEDNNLTPYGIATGGPMPAIGDGHYAHLKPLPPGDHVLELGGSVCDGDAVWFETAATYHLHVEE